MGSFTTLVPGGSGCLISRIPALGSGSASGFQSLHLKNGVVLLALLVCLGSYEQKPNCGNQGGLHRAGYGEVGVLSHPSWPALKFWSPAHTRYLHEVGAQPLGIKGGIE